MPTNAEEVIIKHDRIHCLVPNLFRSQPKGVRRQPIAVDYDYNENTKVMIRGYESLGADDLLYLQGMLALCAAHKGKPIRQPKSRVKQADHLWVSLDPKEGAVNQEFMSITFKIGTLLSLVGLSIGKMNRDSLKRSLMRMSNITIFMEQKDKKSMWSSHILGFSRQGKELTVALNLAITQSVLGGIYTTIPIKEIREIRHAPARLLHQRLCGIIDPGSTHCFSTDKLVEYVYGDTETTKLTYQGRCDRKTAVKKGMKEIENIGWEIEEEDGIFRVARPELFEDSAT